MRKLFQAVLVVFLFLWGAAVLAVPVVSPTDIPRIDPARVESQLAVPAPALKKATIIYPQEEKAAEAVHMPKISFVLKKIILEGSTVYSDEELRSLYQDSLNKKISLLDLEKIVNRITYHYRNAGYILTRAVLPAQSIKNGVVHIRVVEGYVDNVDIQGKVTNGTKRLLESYGRHVMDANPLTLKILERYSLLANDLPGLTVKSVLSASKHHLGASNLTWVVESKRTSISAGYNNHGTRYMGPLQWSLTPRVRQLLGTNDELGANIVETPTNDDMRFMQAFYSRPLFSTGLLFNASADYTRTRPGFTLESLHLKGESKSWMMGLRYPIYRSRRTNFSLYTNFKWLDAKTDYSSAILYQDNTRSLRFGADFNTLDRWWGIDDLNVEVAKGLRAFGASKHDPAVPLSRLHGRSDFTKVDATLSRTQLLGAGFSALLGAEGQETWKPLLSSEEFGFGGMYYGRGYDSAEIIGDRGVAGKAELHYDQYPGRFGLRHIQYFIFYDIGFVENIDAAETDQYARASATSAGVGAALNLTNHLVANFLLAKPLTHPVQTMVDSNHNGNGWRGFFSIGLHF